MTIAVLRRLEALTVMRIRPVEPLLALRAVGISLVVANHAAVGVPLTGGLNILLLLSGVSFAGLAFHGDTRGTVRSIFPFVTRLMQFAVVLTLLAFVKDGEFRLFELLMVSNWATTDKLSPYPIWYVQTLLQMLLILAVLFLAFDLSPKMERRPVSTAFAFVLGSVVAALVAKHVWNPLDLKGHLPHLHLWNFVLGWLYWALFLHKGPCKRSRLTFFMVSIFSAYWMIGPGAQFGGGVRFYVFSAAITFLTVSPKLSLPHSLAQIVYLIGQASLYLFFLHWALFRVAGVGLSAFQPVSFGVESSVEFCVAMTGGVLSWVFVTAASRTWIKDRFARGLSSRGARDGAPSGGQL